MNSWKYLAGGVAAAAITASIAPAAEAQVTTARMNGVVTSAAGAPVPGAVVTIIHTPSGTVDTARTGADGFFSARGLRTGGPYTVSATAPTGTAREENIFIQVNEQFTLDLRLLDAAVLDEVVVTGQAPLVGTNAGPSSVFDLETVQSLPTISRDIRDIARVDPLVSVDQTNSGAISIAGSNNRFNSLSIDGIKLNDLFGLNSNGFPSQRSPISVDAVSTLSVEVAPYDVEFSGFQGGTVNILSKSGENDLFGSLYYFATNDTLAGDEIGDERIDRDFREEVYGATLGGPIIEDTLFFFVSYEKLEEQASLFNGPRGSSAVNQGRNAITQAEYDQVRQIVQDVYGFDAGGFEGAVQPVEDEKILATVDWNILPGQRAKFTYIQNEGAEVQERNNGADLGSPSTFYNRSEETEAYAVQVFSDWTDAFSTEFKLAYSEQITGQVSLGGTDFANFEVDLDPGTGRGEERTISIGPDFFRQANELENELWQFKLAGTYELGRHLLKVGYERDDQETFNLFVPGSAGNFRFEGLANLQNRVASELFYQNAISNNAADGAADWGFAINSLYIQDEWQVSDRLEILAGLRYELYESSGTIVENPNFVARYGFTNTTDVDGLDILLPRLSAQYELTDTVRLRGGIGRFSGGNPAVWLSNNYSNTGVGIDDVFIPGPIPNVDGFNLPQAALDALQAGDGSVNVLDPDFEIPSVYRATLGVDFDLDRPDLYLADFSVSLDYIYEQGEDQPFWRDISCGDPLGAAPDGRPVYNCGVDPAVLNPILAAEGVQGVIDYYRDNRRVAEVAPEALLLSNDSEIEKNIITVRFSKGYEEAGVRIGGSYTFQDVEDAHSGTSSTASSNYSDYATFDRQNPFLATSNYEIEHEFKLFLNWDKEFVDGYETGVTLFGTRRSGQPFSYTYDYSGGASRSLFGIREGRADDEGELFYVPNPSGDPVFNAAASFGGDQDTLNAFYTFLQQSGLDEFAGGFAPRNEFRSRWYSSIDLRLTQELPGFRAQDRTTLFFDIENLGNLINPDWGRLEQVRYEYFQPVANVDVVNGQYVYSGFPERSERRVFDNASLWQAQFGIRYQF